MTWARASNGRLRWDIPDANPDGLGEAFLETNGICFRCGIEDVIVLRVRGCDCPVNQPAFCRNCLENLVSVMKKSEAV